MTADAPAIEVIDSDELAKRWKVPVSWVRSYSRERCPKAERIPHLQFGRYIRYEFHSPAFEAWLSKHREGTQ
ncbi:MAG: hypothetical protein ABSC64_12800 [Candidatus Korobacteraceae bacterium]|jgi:hypothetical protein